MGSETHSYLLNCIVDPAKSGLLASLRAAHLEYIISNQDKIIYGGVMGSPGEPPEGICITIRANSLADADAMAQADPYAQAYSDIHVSEFQQRIPEEYPGQLASVLGSIIAGSREVSKKGI